MTLSFLADENVPRDLVDALQTDGHDVLWVAKAAPGSPDSVLLSWAVDEGRVVLTADKDFGELVIREGRGSAGVCLLRMSTSRVDEVIARVLRLLSEHEPRLPRSLTVVEKERFRFRPLVSGA